MIRYAVFPGWTTGTRDAADQYLSALDLIRLYGVSEAECIVVPSDEVIRELPTPQAFRRAWNLKRQAATLIPLMPSVAGVYVLPVLLDEQK